MRKRFASLLLLLSLVIGLSGCHGSKGLDPFVLPQELDTQTPIEITFWAKNDTNKAQTEVYQKAIDDFHALYPNITVQLRLYTDYGKIYNDVITNIATQTTPNVCITYPDHIATYRTGVNVVVPLDELMRDPQYGLGGSALKFDGPALDEVVAPFLKEGVIDGVQYAMPYMRSTEACYINKTMVEQLGYTVPDVLTWDYIWEVADAATKQDASGTYLVNGQKVMIPFIYKSTDNMMIQMLRQQEAPYSTEEGEVLLFNDTTKGILLEIAEHVEKGSFSTFKISSYPANFLNAGQCIFAIDSTAGSTWMGSEAPLSDISEDKFVMFETAVRPVPQYDPQHPLMISQGPSICIFNKANPQEVLASWLFTQFLLTDEIQMSYAQTEGYVPVTTKAQQNQAYQDYLSREGEDTDTHYAVKLQATKLLLDNTDNTFVTPVFNGSTSLRDASGQLIENVTKAVRRKQTINAQAIDELYTEVNALYRLDQLNRVASVEREDLGPLPAGAKWLLGGLVTVWVLLALFFLRDYVAKRKEK